ncbi:MAG: hypothetical protein ACRDV4_07920 [Acidimicrobiales bacterium]
MGAAALVVAVPVGIVTALLGPSMFASAAAAQDPIMCNLSGSVTFNPPLTKAGDNTGKGSVETVTLDGLSLSHCLSSDSSGAPSSGSISNQTLTIAATKSGKGKSAEYLTGYCPGFASSSSLKALKKLTLTTNWTGGAGGSTTVETKSGAVAANSSGEAGFAIVEKFESGNYPTKVAQTIAYLTSADTAEIGSCSGSISSISFDGTTSTALG